MSARKLYSDPIFPENCISSQAGWYAEKRAFEHRIILAIIERDIGTLPAFLGAGSQST
jgi:hypothetical protein